MIISVGYRVKSQRGTQFRRWATERLREYIIKGFTLDDERLKQGGGRYFKELLQRVRDIRSSERNLYQQVTDIYATIIEHITYDKLDERWNADEIFVDPPITGEYGKNVIDAKKHLFDKIRYDSAIEKNLAGKMDINENVELYIKLPSGFYINTPMGKYNPDWAITFKEGSVKHIYFVAEAKGDTSDIQLRGVEKAKIECARRHFAKISNSTVKYSVVSSYTELMTAVQS